MKLIKIFKILCLGITLTGCVAFAPFSTLSFLPTQDITVDVNRFEIITSSNRKEYVVHFATDYYFLIKEKEDKYPLVCAYKIYSPIKKTISEDKDTIQPVDFEFTYFVEIDNVIKRAQLEKDTWYKGRLWYDKLLGHMTPVTYRAGIPHCVYYYLTQRSYFWYKMYYPTGLFLDATDGETSKIEIAFTPWKNVEDIDIQHAKLKWYSLGDFIRLGNSVFEPLDTLK